MAICPAIRSVIFTANRNRISAREGRTARGVRLGERIEACGVIGMIDADRSAPRSTSPAFGGQGFIQPARLAVDEARLDSMSASSRGWLSPTNRDQRSRAQRGQGLGLRDLPELLLDHRQRIEPRDEVGMGFAEGPLPDADRPLDQRLGGVEVANGREHCRQVVETLGELWMILAQRPLRDVAGLAPPGSRPWCSPSFRGTCCPGSSGSWRSRDGPRRESRTDRVGRR